MISPGLFGEGTISFESISNPGRYLRNRDGKIYIEEGDEGDEQFKIDCSWFSRMDHFFKSFISFESVLKPGWFIRHNNRRLELSFISSNTDKNDASFIMANLSDGEMERVEEVWRQFLGKTILVESKAVPQHFWAWNDGNQRDGEGRLELEGHVFRMVSGLWGDETVSFESSSIPGYYMRTRGTSLWVERGDMNNLEFRKECSFNARDGRFFAGYTSFESAGQPDHWIRQSNRQLKLETVQSYQDNNDASFFLSEAEPRTTIFPTVPTTTTILPIPSRRPRPVLPPITPAPGYVDKRPSKLLNILSIQTKDTNNLSLL